ncbi:MAG: rhodanese-like domain-containing protein [Betaproteobacteria bacterium]|nr:rhodanese-like domain-containing protein [Betaproteobacteria bacterium]
MGSAVAAPPPDNRLIDYDGFLAGAQEVAALRKERRISEEDFIRMSQEPGTVILDARSDGKYRMLHVRGARNLSLPDITEGELAKIIPSKTTRVLIYCNNNFLNEAAAFPTKAVRASLNVYTFNTLHSYGYTNIYELGPLIDIGSSKLPFAGERLVDRR